MTKSEIVTYVADSFQPIQLVTGAIAQLQSAEEAIRWFDREGADVSFKMFAYNQQNVMTLSDDVDVVVNVYLDRVVTEIFTAQTLLLGVTILDYDIQTLALKMNHLSDLRTFLASRFRWRWLRPYLYVDGMTTSAANLVVQYLKKYDYTDPTQDITGGPLDWVIRYATALLKQREGRILRMGSVIQAPLDGSELMSEGKTEQIEIMNDLRRVRAVMPIGRSF